MECSDGRVSLKVQAEKCANQATGYSANAVRSRLLAHRRRGEDANRLAAGSVTRQPAGGRPIGSPSSAWGHANLNPHTERPSARSHSRPTRAASWPVAACTDREGLRELVGLTLPVQSVLWGRG